MQNNILEKNITSKGKKNAKKIEFDLSFENIYLPKNGAYIALEFLGYMEDKRFIPYSKEQSDSAIQFTPSFSNNKNIKSWYKSTFDSKWRELVNSKDSEHRSFMISVEIEQ